jgi:ABC transporter with metal-binding/Fe-S-binding domain ATP-binding protein
MAEPWVSLFSGGKDSSWALYRALEEDHPVETLVTVHPPEGSYLYHTPATDLAGLAAQSMGLDHLGVETDVDVDGARDVGDQGDRELEPLEAALLGYREDHGGLGGVTAGAVASTYQADRLAAMSRRLGCDLFTPLWGADPLDAGRAMVDAGFDCRVIRVAADGLDASWLGRRLDHDALDELVALNEARGVHVLGEGGEYETLVVDGPHFDRAIEFEAAADWHGTHGTLRIEDAWLEPP